MKKIGIMGVHGAGKTSLAYLLSAHFKMKEINVKLIHESVRENCPFPINAQANQGTCLWNFHKHFLNELNAEAQGYELAVSDRCVLDTFVYFHAANAESKITRAAMQQAIEWLSSYDLLICMEPAEHGTIQDDGIRETDVAYQRLIEKGFREAVALCDRQTQENVLYMSSKDVFDEEYREQLLYRVDELMNIGREALTLT